MKDNFTSMDRVKGIIGGWWGAQNVAKLRSCYHPRLEGVGQSHQSPDEDCEKGCLAKALARKKWSYCQGSGEAGGCLTHHTHPDTWGQAAQRRLLQGSISDELDNQGEGQRNHQIILFALPNWVIPILKTYFINLEEAQKSLKHTQFFMNK